MKTGIIEIEKDFVKLIFSADSTCGIINIS